MDGIAITIHGTDNPYGPGSLAFWGNVIRHDIQHGKVVSSRTIYGGGDASFACISPLGDRVAFLKKDLSIAVTGIEGGQEQMIGALEGPDGEDKDRAQAKQENHLTEAGAKNIAAYMQWIRTDGEDWIYYVGGFGGERSTYLRRVNVKTHRKELVIRFNREVTSFGLSADTAPGHGKFAARPSDGQIIVYDFSAGTGDLYTSGEVVGCGVCVAPNGLYFAGNNGLHTAINIFRMDETLKTTFKVNQWAKAGGDKARAFYHARYAANSPEWVGACQGGAVTASGGDYTNTVLYNWARHQQVQVTQNAPGGFDRAEGFWLRGLAANNFELGFYSGKLPLSVQLAPHDGKGLWTWDYGDGSIGTGPVGAHTYKAAGDYIATARQGKRRLTAHIAVEERQPPSVSSITPVDPAHLLVVFSEPVRLTGFGARLQSPHQLKSSRLSDDGRQLTLEFDGPIVKDDVLTLQGVEDRAQVPNSVRNNVQPVKRLSWPSNHKDLEFCWGTAKRTNAVYDETNGLGKVCNVLKSGDADLDQNGAMSLRGGWFEAVEGWQGIYESCRERHALTVEATITPAVADQGDRHNPKRIISFAWAVAEDFWIAQVGSQLVFNFGTSIQHRDAPVTLCTVVSGQPNHIIISYKPGELICYLNGKQVFHTDSMRTSFDNWARARLCVGRRQYAAGWQGRVEGLAIFSRTMGSQEALEDYQIHAAKLGIRAPSTNLEIDGTLIAVSHVPTAAEIVPYRDVLVVNEYKVKQVLHGAYAPRTIRVAHWGLLDGQAAPAAHYQMGQDVHLSVQPMEQHPELEQKYRSDTLPDNFDLPVYTDAKL
ncbi:MAG: hypothetical protein M3Y56_11560 [Armatimonadota bacterium]|nr:hypothetical protein [Armatimonadota bacterium]